MPEQTPLTAPSPLAVDAAGAAKLIGCSRSHWLRMHREGKTPPSFTFGHRRLWRQSDIEVWVAAGFPACGESVANEGGA